MSVNVMRGQVQEKKVSGKKVPGLTLGHLRTRLVEWGLSDFLSTSFWEEFLRSVQRTLPADQKFFYEVFGHMRFGNNNFRNSASGNSAPTLC